MDNHFCWSFQSQRGIYVGLFSHKYFCRLLGKGGGAGLTLIILRVYDQRCAGVQTAASRGAPWVSVLVGHFVQTWPDSECSHTVQFLDSAILRL